MECTLGREYISIEIATDLWNFFKEKTNLDRDIKIACFQSEDEEFGVEFALNEKEYYEFLNLVLPYYCYTCNDEDIDLRNILKVKYNFDMFTYIKGLTHGINAMVFSLFHEFGHLHQYLTTTSEEFYRLTYEYQYGLRRLDELKEKGFEQTEYQYRNLPQEKYADTIAIILMRKYEKELYELLKKYNVGYEEEMVCPYGNYFEI